MANEVEIIVEPVEPSGLPVERLREWLAADRNLQEVLGDVDVESLLLSEPEILQRERKDNSPFIATVFDPQQNRAVEVSGFVDQQDSLRIKPSSYRPLPTREELSNALDILRADSRYASRVNLESEELKIRRYEREAPAQLDRVLEELAQREIIDTAVISSPDARFYPVSLDRFIREILDQEFPDGPEGG